MNKQYKLIKWYPGLPECLKEGDYVERVNGRSYHPFGNLSHPAIYSKSVEENPDFWEEVEQKDYEVLSYIGVHTGYLYDKGSDDLYHCEHEPWVTANPVELEKGEIYNVHSVRRISDGEVFTVGDKIQYGEEDNDFSKGSSKYCKLKYFSLRNNTIYVNSHYAGSLDNTIDKWVKYRKPIFTTEDGVDMYEGDEYWFIGKGDTIIRHVVGSSWSIVNSKNDHKRFSTKQKAQEYINNCKPKYSKEDIRNAVSNIGQLGIENTPDGKVECTVLLKRDLFKELDI